MSGIRALEFPFTLVRRHHPECSINQSVTPKGAHSSARLWPEKRFPREPDRAWSMLLANSCFESLRLHIVQKTRMLSLWLGIVQLFGYATGKATGTNQSLIPNHYPSCFSTSLSNSWAQHLCSQPSPWALRSLLSTENFHPWERWDRLLQRRYRRV